MDIYQDEKHVTAEIFRAYFFFFFGTISDELSALVYSLLCVNGNNRLMRKLKT